MHLHVKGGLCPGDGGFGLGVYFNTMSVQRRKIDSGICSFQLTSLRKTRSLLLISQTLSPDILLQALAE